MNRYCSFLRAAVVRPTTDYDYHCDCYECNLPTRWQRLLSAVGRVLFS